MGNTGKSNTGLRTGTGVAAGTALSVTESVLQSKQYLVEGAKLVCVNGSIITELKVPQSHNYTSGGKKKANCKDCKACENISYFGECCKNQDTHLCEGYMDLAEKWENTAATTTKLENVNGEDAITMNSVLLCKKGGIIIPITSGQGYDGKINWEDFLKRYQSVIRWAIGQNLYCHVFGKDPINMNTGNYIYEKEDLIIGGIMPLSFKIFYNAMDSEGQGTLGEGWSHNYGMHLKKIADDNLLSIILEDGREVIYQRKLENEYIPIMGDKGTLEKFHNGYYYKSKEWVYEFDTEGKLKKQTNRNNKSRLFIYNDDGLLTGVENEVGNQLSYTYNEEKKLIRVADHTGRLVELSYEYGRLRRFTNSSGHTYTYEYNENGKMAGIVTPEGVSGVKNEYDGADRVIKQTMSDSGVVELRYDDKNNCTYLKEQNGNLIKYESDEKMRNVRTVYEDGEESFVYNERNQKISYTDKNGNTTRYSYDNHGNMTQVITALGEKTCMTYDQNSNLIAVKKSGYGSVRYKYDGNGNCVQITEADGGITQIEYRDDGSIDTIIQPDRSRIHYIYDKKGNVIQVITPSGSSIFYEYDLLNRVIQSKDGNGNIRKYEYNNQNKLIALTNPIGKKQILSYDIDKLVSVTDYDGSQYRMQYAYSKPCKYIDSEGNITHIEYDAMGNLIKEEFPNGRIVKRTYNKLNQLESIVDGESEVLRFQYDKNGNKIKAIDPDGNQTMYTYDACNRMTGVYEPDGFTTIYEYNKQGKIGRVVFNSENYIEISYDSCGRKLKERDIYGKTVTYIYNKMGHPEKIIEGDKRETTFSYYPGGFLKKIQYPDGTSENYNYDNNANIIEKSDQNGYSHKFMYDALDRVIKITSNMGESISYEYNDIGKIAAVTDGNGNRNCYFYTSAGKLKRITDALGNNTEYEYDKAGYLISISSQGKRLADNFSELSEIEELNHNNKSQRKYDITYKRDLQGRLTSIMNGQGYGTCFEYDKYGNIVKETDAEGYTTEYKYNVSDQMTEVVYDGDHKARFIYDSNRNLIEVNDWLGTTKINVDKYGRAVEVIDYEGRTITYSYHENGQTSMIGYPDGHYVRYYYDEFQRLTEVDGENWGESIHYDKDGNIDKRIYKNGLSSTYSYDKANRLTSFTHMNEEKILDRYDLSYDSTGNVINIKKERSGLGDLNGEYTYYYDKLNRLENIKKDGRIISSYQYDEFGNRICVEDKGKKITYYYNSMNQLIKEEGESTKEYAYDRRGNLIQCINDGRENEFYEFNSMNRLSRYIGKDGCAVTYNYNALGHRVNKVISNKSDSRFEKYRVDITKGYNNLLCMEDGSKSQEFIWDYQLAGAWDSSDSRYFLIDELHSPIRYTAANGRVLENYDYNEFGNCVKGSLGTMQPFGFTGYQWDRESGNYYVHARQYMPLTGRFISQDLYGGNLGAAYTLNYYNYCYQNPLRYLDPTGYFTSPEGLEAHTELQAYFLCKYPGNSEVEKKVEGYPYSKTGEGRIDLLLLNNGHNQMEVYEIKPISQRNGKTYWQKVLNLPSGEEQRLGYVQALQKEHRVNAYGTTFNPNGLELPSLIHPDKNIKYYTFPDKPGMIYYGYVKKPIPDPEPATEPATKPVVDEETVKNVIFGVEVGVGVYIGYRIIRLIPSIFCPPTLVPNLVCP